MVMKLLLIMIILCFYSFSINADENQLNLSEAEYKTAIEVLSKTSQHTPLILETIYHRVLPYLNHPTSMLDVGAGPGIMTQELNRYFEKVDAVEPNRQLESLYQNKSVKLFPVYWSEFNENQEYDFVLCSHTLYHMNKEEMKEFIVKLLKYTKPDGVCLIAMMAPRGQNHELHTLFNPYYINSGQVKEILDELGVTYEIVSASNHFQANSYDQMAALCRFFVLEDCLTKSQHDQIDLNSFEASISQLTHSLQQPDGTFTLGQEEDYFIMKSPSRLKPNASS